MSNHARDGNDAEHPLSVGRYKCPHVRVNLRFQGGKLNSSSFVGRTKELERLRQVLLRDDSRGLVIQSIEGPGGIGKSSIFNRALADLDLVSQGFLILRMDGNQPEGAGLEHLIRSLIDSAEFDKIPDKPIREIFPRTTDAISSAERIRSESREEFKKIGGDDTDPSFDRFINAFLSVGKTINQVAPGSKSFVDAEELSGHAPNIAEAAEKLHSLKEDAGHFWEKFSIGDSAKIRKEIRRGGAPRAFSQCLVDDLKQIVLGKSEAGESQAGFGSVRGTKRVLVVIDDYESLQSVVSEFLISHFLEYVKKIGFAITIVILGRDKLSVTNTSWNQHHSFSMANPIVIKPLSKEEVNEVLEKLDVHDPVEKERAWIDTNGYPYYLALWAEELDAGGRSAVMLNQFYSRITKWMTSRQRGWLDQLVHMQTINLSTLKAVFDTNEAEEVMSWFENEASVRDPKTSSYTVREYTRSRILEYLALRDPDGYQTLARNAARVPS